MKISRWGAAVAGLVGALTLAAPAAAQDAGGPLAEHDGLTVTQAACEDGGGITVTADGIEFLVSSGVRTAGLAARIAGGDTAAQLQTDHTDGPATATGETVEIPAPTADGVLEYRWFGGPDRAGDSPQWDLAGHPDWVDTVVAREEAEGRYWDARDDAPFVTWYQVEVTGCPSPSPSPSAPASTPAPSPEVSEPAPVPGEAGGQDELPLTGVPAGWLAGGAVALLAAGGGLFLVARRRRVSFTA